METKVWRISWILYTTSWLQTLKRINKLRMYRGISDGSVVKNQSANAGDLDSIPDPGRPHRPWTTKPMLCNYCACAPEPGSHSYWPVDLEPEFCSKGSPCTTTGERSPHVAAREKLAQHRKPRAAKNKQTNENTANLQCFRWTAKWLSYIFSFLDSFPL